MVVRTATFREEISTAVIELCNASTYRRQLTVRPFVDLIPSANPFESRLADTKSFGRLVTSQMIVIVIVTLSYTRRLFLVTNFISYKKALQTVCRTKCAHIDITDARLTQRALTVFNGR